MSLSPLTIALVATCAWLLLRGRRPVAKQNPGGTATGAELGYTDYLTARPDDGKRPMDFAEWAAKNGF